MISEEQSIENNENDNNGDWLGSYSNNNEIDKKIIYLLF